MADGGGWKLVCFVAGRTALMELRGRHCDRREEEVGAVVSAAPAPRTSSPGCRMTIGAAAHTGGYYNPVGPLAYCWHDVKG